jgi:hypothetical protein
MITEVFKINVAIAYSYDHEYNRKKCLLQACGPVSSVIFKNYNWKEVSSYYTRYTSGKVIVPVY